MDGCRVSIMANSSTVVEVNAEDVCGRRRRGEMEMICMFCANTGYRLFRIPSSVIALQNVQRDFPSMDSNVRRVGGQGGQFVWSESSPFSG